jgi:hypothetical protein
MTSIHTYNPADGAVPPELPPMTIATMAVGLVDLLSEAENLPQPRYISIHGSSQSCDLQFGPEQPSLKAITRWAMRFGGVVISKPHQGKDGPETWYRTDFDYYGIAVSAYAHIPATKAST